MGPSSNSEPKLHSSHRRLGGTRFKISGEANVGDDDMGGAETSKRLQRMKAQSKKTFKFRKTRRRNMDDTSVAIEGVIIEQSSPPETSTTTTQTPSTSCISTSIASSAQRKTSTAMKPVR